MHNTTNLWRITEPSITNGRKSECSHAHDVDSRHTHLVKNEYQTIKSTTSAHQHRRKKSIKERKDSVNKSTISRSSSQNQIKTKSKAPPTLQTLDTNDGGAHYHGKSHKPCYAPHKHALQAGLYKSDAPQWLCYERWLTLSQNKHSYNMKCNIRTIKLAKIR